MVIKIYPGFEKPILEQNIGGNSIPHGTNLYEILGINKTASKAQILKAFNKLVADEHPDKKNGVRTEKYDLLEKAKATLFNAKDEYNNLIDNEGWLDKSNNKKFRDKIINFLEDKIGFYDHYGHKNDGTPKYLPTELQNWKNEIENATEVSYEEINSYAALLIEIYSNCIAIEQKYKNKIGFNLPRIVKKFAGLQSKIQTENTFEEIEEEFAKTDGGGTKESKRRKGLKDLKNLSDFSRLIDEADQKGYLEEMKNASQETEHGIILKSLDQVIAGILNKVKKRLEFLREKEKKEKKLKPLKEKFIQKLHALQGWNELLEPWEQDHLEEKINTVSENNESFFNTRLTYASYLIQGGHMRKYRAKFWDNLEKLTDLQKEDITDGDDIRKGKKTGERYESIQKKYKGLEPQPIERLDGPNFTKMKLFLCYYKKEASLNWYSLLLKVIDYGDEKDSGWKPSPRSNDLLKHERNLAVKAIEKELKRYAGSKKDDEVLGKNWKSRFDKEGDSSKKIIAIREDFLDRLSDYKSGNPRPWTGGEEENHTPPTDPLKDKKEKAIAEILKESFDNDPVIDKDKLEKNNQNWEKDINNASKEEKINFIKASVINDIKNKRVKEKEKNTLDELINKAKKDENWNDYQNLENLLKKIKELQFSVFYKKNESEIYAIEKRLKELNPKNFKNSIKNDLNEKAKSYGLSREDISDNETQKLFDEAIESGDLEKKTKAEEHIIQKGTDKKLDSVINIVKKAIKKGDLSNDQKEELITKILECISENEYQKKAYQRQKDKVDNLLSILKGEEEYQNKDPAEEVSWPKTIAAAAVISLSVTILVFAVMKARTHRKPRKI